MSLFDDLARQAELRARLQAVRLQAASYGLIKSQSGFKDSLSDGLESVKLSPEEDKIKSLELSLEKLELERDTLRKITTNLNNQKVELQTKVYLLESIVERHENNLKLGKNKTKLANQVMEALKARGRTEQEAKSMINMLITKEEVE